MRRGPKLITAGRRRADERETGIFTISSHGPEVLDRRRRRKTTEYENDIGNCSTEKTTDVHFRLFLIFPEQIELER
jgi:hypothetical protein